MHVLHPRYSKTWHSKHNKNDSDINYHTLDNETNNSFGALSTKVGTRIYTRGEIAHMLIDWGADVEAIGHRNKRPLHYAATSRDPEYVSALLSRGASVDPLDSHGRTPLTRAVIA